MCATPSRRFAIPFFALALLSAIVSAPSAHADEPDSRLLVTVDAGTANPVRAATQAVVATGATVVDARQVSPTVVAVTSDGATDPDEVAERSQIAAAEPDLVMRPSSSVDDAYWTQQWNLNGPHGVDAEAAWTVSDGTGSVIGIIDTGLTRHPDVDPNVLGGYDFVTSPSMSGDGDGADADFSDEPCPGGDTSWHGTAVASLAVGARNGVGVVGVAPGARIEMLRALGVCGNGTGADVLTAMRWAAGLSVPGYPTNPHPVDVLSMSLSGAAPCPDAYQTTIDQIVAAGIPVVVAAGNNADELAEVTPANCQNVIRVTASTSSGALAGFSDYGTDDAPATVAAPGQSVPAASNSGTTAVGQASWKSFSGTSASTPQVAAVAAMLKATDKDLAPAQVLTRLKSTAAAVSGCAPVRCGSGVVNATDAVGASRAAPTPAASPAPEAAPVAMSAKVGISTSRKRSVTARVVVTVEGTSAVMSVRAILQRKAGHSWVAYAKSATFVVGAPGTQANVTWSRAKKGRTVRVVVVSARLKTVVSKTARVR